MEAKQTLLRVFSQHVRNQIQDSIYSYDLKEMSEQLIKLEASKMLPLFSFLPLAGGRPQKQSDVASVSLGGKTLEPNTQQQPVQQQTVQPVRQNMPNVSMPRNSEFQNYDQGRPNTTNVLTQEQAALVQSIGAIPAFNGADEGTSARINASTGRNLNLRQNNAQPQTSNGISQEQAELLQKFSQNSKGPQIMQEDIAESREVGIVEDASLTAIDNRVMSDADIAKLQEEIKGS
jgi:hypothetical protein